MHQKLFEYWYGCTVVEWTVVAIYFIFIEEVGYSYTYLREKWTSTIISIGNNLNINSYDTNKTLDFIYIQNTHTHRQDTHTHTLTNKHTHIK